MNRATVTAIAVLAMTVCASAKDAKTDKKPDENIKSGQQVASLPVCTPKNGPLEVIFGTCFLVKGVPLYGQGMEDLAGITNGMLPSGGGVGGTGGAF